jgi:hypothetical protein
MAKKTERAPRLLVETGRGFQITFENCYTVSVMFGPHHDCSNRTTNPAAFAADHPPRSHKSPNAEVAVLDPDGDLMELGWFRENHLDSVIGYVPPDEVAQLIAEVRLLPNIKNMREV